MSTPLGATMSLSASQKPLSPSSVASLLSSYPPLARFSVHPILLGNELDATTTAASTTAMSSPFMHVLFNLVHENTRLRHQLAQIHASQLQSVPPSLPPQPQLLQPLPPPLPICSTTTIPVPPPPVVPQPLPLRLPLPLPLSSVVPTSYSPARVEHPAPAATSATQPYVVLSQHERKAIKRASKDANTLQSITLKQQMVQAVFQARQVLADKSYAPDDIFHCIRKQLMSICEAHGVDLLTQSNTSTSIGELLSRPQHGAFTQWRADNTEVQVYSMHATNCASDLFLCIEGMHVLVRTTAPNALQSLYVCVAPLSDGGTFVYETPRGTQFEIIPRRGTQPNANLLAPKRTNAPGFGLTIGACIRNGTAPYMRTELRLPCLSEKKLHTENETVSDDGCSYDIVVKSRTGQPKPTLMLKRLSSSNARSTFTLDRTAASQIPRDALLYLIRHDDSTAVSRLTTLASRVRPATTADNSSQLITAVVHPHKPTPAQAQTVVL